MNELRRFPRINIELEIQMHFDSLDSVIYTRTIDISRVGLFIATKETRPPGTKVRFTLTLENPPTRIALEGVVTRVQEDLARLGLRHGAGEHGIGVELTHKPSEWDRLCEEVFAQRGDPRAAQRSGT